MTVVGLSALRTGRLYLPENTPGTHFCKKLSRPQGHSALLYPLPSTPTSSSKPISSGFPTKTLYIFLFSLYMLHASPISFSFIGSRKQYPLRSTDHTPPHYAVLSNPHHSLTPTTNIALSTLFSNTLRLCSSLSVKRPSFTLIQNSRQNYSSVYPMFIGPCIIVIVEE